MMHTSTYERLLRLAIPLDIPNGEAGPWKIDDVVVTEEKAKFENLRCAIRGEVEAMVAPGTYKRLSRSGVVVMSNTPFEVLTNTQFIQAAKGRVLINGLGIGMVLKAILAKPEVTEVHVVENSADVIRLVAHHYPDPRLKIHHADAFTFSPEGKFDAVWHDIWDTVCADNLPEMAKLNRKYAKRTAWQGCWCQDICRRMNRKDY